MSRRILLKIILITLVIINEIIEMIERLRIENSKLNDNIINYFATYLINNQNGCFVDTSYFVAWRKHRNIIEKKI